MRRSLLVELISRSALVLLASLVTLGLLEVGLRFVTGSGPGLRGLHELRPDRPWLYELRPHAETTVDGVRYAINADGFRDYDYARPKPADTFRVLVLGDSIAFGWGVPLDETFPKVLEARLRALLPGRHVEVLNIAVSGYNPYTEAALMRGVGVGYEPDLVLVEFCINDLNDPTLHFDTSTVAALHEIPAEAFPDPARRLPPPGWCRRLRVCSLVLDRLPWTDSAPLLHSLEPHDDPPPTELAWLRARYQDIATAAASTGAGFAVIAFPYQPQVERGTPGTIEARLVALGDAASWPTVDLLPPLRAAQASGNGPVFIDFYHPTAIGHRVAAESILKELGCRGLLPAGCHDPGS